MWQDPTEEITMPNYGDIARGEKCPQCHKTNAIVWLKRVENDQARDRVDGPDSVRELWKCRGCGYEPDGSFNLKLKPVNV